jgi:hypothetical protein
MHRPADGANIGELVEIGIAASANKYAGSSRAYAATLPIPRLPPVMSATFRSTLLSLLAISSSPSHSHS